MSLCVLEAQTVKKKRFCFFKRLKHVILQSAYKRSIKMNKESLNIGPASHHNVREPPLPSCGIVTAVCGILEHFGVADIVGRVLIIYIDGAEVQHDAGRVEQGTIGHCGHRHISRCVNTEQASLSAHLTGVSLFK